MKEQFVPYEQAVQLKELGFNESCLAWYVNPHKLDYCFNHNTAEGMKSDVSAPLWQQAFEWFRKTQLLHSAVDFYIIKELEDKDIELYEYKINEQWSVGKEFYDFSYGFKHIKCEYHFRSYEEARLECLKELIKIQLSYYPNRV